MPCSTRSPALAIFSFACRSTPFKRVQEVNLNAVAALPLILVDVRSGLPVPSAGCALLGRAAPLHNQTAPSRRMGEKNKATHPTLKIALKIYFFLKVEASF